MDKFPRKDTKSVGKLKALVENRGKFRGTGFKNYSWHTIRAFGFRVVEVENGFTSLACRKFDR